MNRAYITLILLLCVFTFTQAQQLHFPQKENTHRLMSYNIHHARGMDDVVDTERIGKLILSVDPELIALQEVDSVVERSGKINTMKLLADQTGMYASYSASIPLQGGKYGNGMLTKEKPIATQVVRLPGAKEARSALVVELEKYVAVCTHLSLDSVERKESVVLINKAIECYNKPVFLLGDLNARPNSEVMAGFRTDWQILNDEKQNTSPSVAPRVTIDYIMGYKTKGETYAKHYAKVVDEKVASDHCPLFVDVRLKAKASEVMRTIPYLQNPARDEMTVMWLTNVPCRSWVEYGTDPGNLQRARTFIEGEMIANNKINAIRLTDLKPGTKYYYRAVSQEIMRYSSYNKVFGDTVQTEIKSFTTWDDKQKDVRVIVYNDIHSNMKMFEKLHKLVDHKPYDLVVFNGDCFDDLEVETDIVDRLLTYTVNYRSNEVPSIFMRGNHETRGEYSVLLWNYLGRMNGHSYSAFNLGDTRFVLLDCGEDKPDDHWVYYDMNDFTGHRKNQANFLKEEINSKVFKNASKRILIHHIPIYGFKADAFNPCGDLWKPILENAPFNISLNAHTHRYRVMEKGEDGNNFPAIIGGGNKEESGTVMILEKQGSKMTLEVLDVEGKTLLKREI